MKLEENYLDVRMTDHDVYQNVDSMNIQDLYQELCANNAEAMMKAQSEGVRDNRELLKLFATFSETSFKKILDYQDNGSR